MAGEKGQAVGRAQEDGAVKVGIARAAAAGTRTDRRKEQGREKERGQQSRELEVEEHPTQRLRSDVGRHPRHNRG